MTSTYREIRVGEIRIIEKIYPTNHILKSAGAIRYFFELSKIRLIDVRVIEVPLYMVYRTPRRRTRTARNVRILLRTIIVK